MPTPTAPPMFIGMNSLPVSGINYLTNPSYSLQNTNNDAVYQLNKSLALYSCNSYNIWAGGTDQNLSLSECGNACVVDVGKGLQIGVHYTDVNMKIYDFQNDTTAKITFFQEGFKSVADVLNHMSSDHDGGTLLTVPGAMSGGPWTIDFRGDTHVTAANIAVLNFGRH